MHGDTHSVARDAPWLFQQLAMTSRARSNECEPLPIDAIDEKPIRLDAVLEIAAICTTKRMVAYRIRKSLTTH